jgi:hypothetical protein
MLARLRRHRLLCAAAGLLLASGLLGEALAVDHSHVEAGALCGLGTVAHNAHAHRIGAADRSAEHAHEHCYVCHWVRSFRPAEQSRRVEADRVLAGRLDLDFSRLPDHLVVSQVPARSPPA